MLKFVYIRTYEQWFAFYTIPTNTFFRYRTSDSLMHLTYAFRPALLGASFLRTRKTSSLSCVTLAQSSQSLTFSSHHNIRICGSQKCTQKSPHCQCSPASNSCPTWALDKPSWYLLKRQVPMEKKGSISMYKHLQVGWIIGYFLHTCTQDTTVFTVSCNPIYLAALNNL